MPPLGAKVAQEMNLVIVKESKFKRIAAIYGESQLPATRDEVLQAHHALFAESLGSLEEIASLKRILMSHLQFFQLGSCLWLRNNLYKMN